LRKAFNEVQNKENWKKEIVAWVQSKDFDVYSKAVEYFTASHLRVVRQEGEKMLVYAEGYYVAVGA